MVQYARFPISLLFAFLLSAYFALGQKRPALVDEDTIDPTLRNDPVKQASRIYQTGGQLLGLLGLRPLSPPLPYQAVLPANDEVIRDASFTKLVNSDFTKIVTLGNATPINQAVFNFTKPTVTLNGVFSTQKTKRMAWRIGGSFEAKVSDEIATLFSDLGYNSDLKFGLNFFKPLRLKYRSTPQVRRNAYHLLSRRSVQKLSEKQAWETQFYAAANDSLLATGATEWDKLALLQPRLDSLRKLRSDEKGFAESFDNALFEIESNVKWNYKKFTWLTFGWSGENQNVVWYDSLIGNLADRFKDRSIFSHTLRAYVNKLTLTNDRNFYGNYYFKLGYEYRFTDEVLESTPVDVSRVKALGQSKGTTYTYNRPKSVYLTRPGVSEEHRFVGQFTQFFSQKRRYGIDLRLSSSLVAGSDSLNHTDLGIGVIVPVVKDDKDNTRLNLIISLDFDDVFYQQSYGGEALPYAKLWDRKTLGVRISLPIVFP